MNKKNILLGSMALAGMLVSTTAFAEDTSVQAEVNVNATVGTNGTMPGNMPPRPGTDKKPFLGSDSMNRGVSTAAREAKKDVMEQRMENKTEMKDMRQEKMGAVKDTHEGNKDEIQGMREESMAKAKITMDALRVELIAKVKSGEITKDEAYKTFNDAAQKQREEAKTAMEAKRAENKDEMKDKKEEVKKDLKEKKAELNNELHQKMQVRFDAMVDRFSKLAERIQSRIDKLTVDGKDMAAAQASLDIAVSSIADIKAKVAVIVIAEGSDQSTQDANKTAVEAIKEAMKKVQKELTGTVSLLK